jgi:hypothetical protein
MLSSSEFLLLEHANAYVRTSASAAIAEAVESWPQSIHESLIKLQAFYREKVSNVWSL